MARTYGALCVKSEAMLLVKAPLLKSAVSTHYASDFPELKRSEYCSEYCSEHCSTDVCISTATQRLDRCKVCMRLPNHVGPATCPARVVR